MASKGPRYAIRLKTLNRYNYRGVLYERRNPETRLDQDFAVTRELRDHLVGTGFFEDVRAEEPKPIEPEPVPEPVPIAEPEAIAAPEVKVGDTPTPVEAVQPPTLPVGNDMSRENLGITKQYGSKTGEVEA